MANGDLMLKGTNRNVIVIRADRNSSFDAAFFIVKKGITKQSSDIVREANRIAFENDTSLCRRAGTLGRGRLFFIGAIVGMLISSCLWGIVVSFTL